MQTDKIIKLFLLMLLVSSCSYGLPLKTNYLSPESNTYLKVIKPNSVYIKPFIDKRNIENLHSIGKINEVVADISSNDLSLDKTLSTLVTDTLKKEFVRSGFTLSINEGEDDSTDYIISGAIKKFEMNIGSRDTIDIEIDYRVVKLRNDKIIFNGSAKVSDDRFAGVTGNTRKSINKYLNNALYNVSRQVLESTGLVLEASITSPKKSHKVNIEELSESRATNLPHQEAGTGTLIISGTPVKTKVYIENVYYGLTPISINIESGVYDASFKKKGFESEKEKISIRSGADTVLEIDLTLIN